MPSRNVSFINYNIQQANSVGASLFPTRWSNFGLAIWSTTETLMLRLELYESWKEQNYVWFKRVPCISLPELKRRQVGSTEWSDEAIVVQGTKIIAPGPPYASTTKRWHFFWANHQSFVEELANVITKNPPPRNSPLLPIHRGPDALATWDCESPIAVNFQTGSASISDDWTGGLGMMYAYPGGPHRKS